MHPCLCIPEILTAIFEEVNRHDLEKISGTRRDLHGLVSTCKTFLGPAITILWRTLSNPVPLLLTMPVDLWELQVTQDVLAACPFPQHKLLVSLFQGFFRLGLNCFFFKSFFCFFGRLSREMLSKKTGRFLTSTLNL